MSVKQTPQLAIALLLALTLTSCGSSNSGSATTAASVSTATHPASTTSSSTSSTTTTSTTTPGGPSPCRAAGLSLSYIGQQGATGKGEIGFALTNKGTVPCHTIGYPGILFLNSSGAALPTNPVHTTHDFAGSVPLSSLVVAPGAKVSFRLFVMHFNANGSNTGCTTAAALQVIPPNDTHTLHVAIGDGGGSECGGRATVTPLAPGTSAFR